MVRGDPLLVSVKVYSGDFVYLKLMVLKTALNPSWHPRVDPLHLLLAPFFYFLLSWLLDDRFPKGFYQKVGSA